jgi:histidine triad (HIT) family protein
MDVYKKDQNFDLGCIFCMFSKGEEEVEVLFQDDNFFVIKDKFPKAPVHLLVIDKHHRKKTDVLEGKYNDESYYEKLFGVIEKLVIKYDLKQSGYKIVNNGGGYNHFEHEHFHVLGGSKEEPHL